MAADPDSLVAPFAEQLGKLALDPANGPEPVRVIQAYRERAETLRELAATVFYLYQDDITVDEKSAKKQLRPVLLAAFETLTAKLTAVADWQADALHAALENTAAEHELKFGKIGQPVRVAVTGGPVSPPLDITMELTGRQRTLQRLQHAIAYMRQRQAQNQ